MKPFATVAFLLIKSSGRCHPGTDCTVLAECYGYQLTAIIFEVRTETMWSHIRNPVSLARPFMYRPLHDMGYSLFTQFMGFLKHRLFYATKFT